MSNFLPTCIANLVAFNRSQNPNFKTCNGFIKQLTATFVLGFLLFGANTTVNAQTNANCYGPYNPTPAAVWGVAEKFQSNALIWNGGTPTAADIDGDGISEILVPASNQSGYFVYKGDGSNKTTATKNYVIATSNTRSVQPAIANIIGAATSAPEVVMVNSAGFVYIFDNVASNSRTNVYSSSGTLYST
jgi:hypothetical protein